MDGLSGLTSLEELYISHNALTKISGLENNTKLRVLDVSKNQISKLENISHLKNLEEFWASDNQLSSFEEVEHELRDKENLETVYFEGNPLQTKGPAVYRNKVRLALPQVKQIDASKFKSSESLFRQHANPRSKRMCDSVEHRHNHEQRFTIAKYHAFYYAILCADLLIDNDNLPHGFSLLVPCSSSREDHKPIKDAAPIRSLHF